MTDKAIVFKCGDDDLIGILSSPEQKTTQSTGVVITVGGPQYRVGSHRQFVTLARALAKDGYYVFRFDYRGMGDSSGIPISFESAGPDIRAAVDTLLASNSYLKDIVLLGLCDAASINLMYSVNDPRVTGLVLMNPWCRTESGKAETELRHYYTKRLIQKDFWMKFFKKKVDFRKSIQEITSKFFKVLASKLFGGFIKNDTPQASLPLRMEAAFLKFTGRICLIISGNDLVAAEFMDRVLSSKKWSRKINSNSVLLIKMAEANHTFSTQQWKDEVGFYIKSWLRS